MAAPLSRRQKAIICQAARRAYDHQLTIGALGDAAEFESWRRGQQQAVAGKESLTSATQDDYEILMARFLDLAGDSGQAMKYLVRGQTNPRRVVMAKIEEECAARGLHIGYADTICRARNHGLSLQDASEKILWQVFYTVRNSKHKRKVAA